MRIAGLGLLALLAAGPVAAHSPSLLTAEQASAVPITAHSATTADGVRLHYRVAGTSGPVVIAPFALYHGSALDRLAKGRRIVTYDPRGRGKSQAVAPDRVSLDLLLADFDTVRRAVGAEQATIIGWSGAGMEMFVYALRNPGRVTRLIHLAPVAPRFVPYGAQMMADREKRTDDAARAAYRKRVEDGEFANDPSAECRARAAVTTPPLFADPADAGLSPDVCDFPNEHSAAIGTYFGALFGSIDGYDWRSALPKVTIPRLVIHPLQDNIPLAGSREWVAGQANARILTIDRSGHFPHYEQPDATLSAIAAFLEGEWPAGAETIP
ncbi:MAG TPA: alpha/beta hydrolase [Sphingomicrobium sp.]|nr:alpha/beta hydrolase [Sphingomicrobium sp.]